MTPVETMTELAEAAPRTKARIAGVFYLGTFVTGIAGLFTGGQLIVSGDAVATANNIAAHGDLVQLGYAANLLATACYVGVTAFLYELFKPVNRSISLLAAFFSLVGCATGAVSFVFQLAPQLVLSDAKYMSVFTQEQLQILAFLFVNLYAKTYNLSLVFFGFYCLLIGYLVLRSTFMPRILGALMVLAGLGWLTFTVPALSKALYPYVLAPGIVGEGALTLWLLAVGVNAKAWYEQAGDPARA